jgi:hypothetical protein
MDEKKKVDDFLEKAANFGDQPKPPSAAYQEYRGRRSKELELWHKWDQGGRKEEDLEPLLKSLDPMIASKARQRHKGLGGRVPLTAVKNELLNHTVHALHKYDPARKTPLSSFVNTNFQAITTWIAASRNTAYMPKAHVQRYQAFENAKNEFKNEFGRDPSTVELKQMLPGWPEKDIEKMQSGFRSEVFSGAGGLEHDTGYEPDVVRSAVLMMGAKMTEEQRRFANLHFPASGKQPDIKAVARQMNIPEHRAYQLKAKVEKLIGPYVKRS